MKEMTGKNGEMKQVGSVFVRALPLCAVSNMGYWNKGTAEEACEIKRTRLTSMSLIFTELRELLFEYVGLNVQIAVVWEAAWTCVMASVITKQCYTEGV